MLEDFDSRSYLKLIGLAHLAMPCKSSGL